MTISHSGLLFWATLYVAEELWSLCWTCVLLQL